MEEPISIDGLHENLILECLVRLDRKDIPSASRVCRKWFHLIQTRDFHTLRKRLRYSSRVNCLLQFSISSNVSDSSTAEESSDYNYVINVFDPVNREWKRLPRIPRLLPEFTKLVGCEGKLVAISVANPGSFEPVTSVFVWDFATQLCWKGKDMPLRSSFIYMVADGCRIFVACIQDRIPGCTMFDTVCVYDVRGDEWSELPRMSQKRGIGQAVITGGELWVINGCSRKRMGGHNAEVYNFETGKWRQVEWGLRGGGGADDVDSCPYCHSRAVECNMVRDLAESLRNKCGVSGPHLRKPDWGYRFYLHNTKDDTYELLDVPNEFSTYVYSRCCVEL